MEDDKLKDIFKDFDPELSSSLQFMTKLQRNMEAVEIVRQYNAALRRRNKLAVAIAGLCGFAVGVTLTLLYPFIVEWISSFNITLSLRDASTLTIDFSYIVWLIVAGVSVFSAWNAYQIALAKLTPKLHASS